jgi:hypothetical protein
VSERREENQLLRLRHPSRSNDVGIANRMNSAYTSPVESGQGCGYYAFPGSFPLAVVLMRMSAPVTFLTSVIES